MIKILIADDQKLMREGLRIILEGDAEISVADVAENGWDAVAKYMLHKPDVVLMDIRMPVMNGVEAVKEIKRMDSGAKILMLTTFDDEDYIVSAVGNGAEGYILKDIDPEELAGTIKDVYSGRPVMQPRIVRTLAEKALGGADRKARDGNVGLEGLLTERETDVARMLARGFNNRQIATALYITEGTAKNHISVIYSKLGIDDRTQLVMYLREQGL